MDFNNTGYINRVGVTANCIMYMLIRLATQNTTQNVDDVKKSFTIVDSINKALSKVEKQ